MTFNRELAKQISGDDDRDRARFFAGREAELDTFCTALDNSAGKWQSVFRVFTGAPGCGKSSLLQRLTDLHQGDCGLLFVHPTRAHLSSVADLMEHVADRAIAEASAVDSEGWAGAVERYGVIALQSAAESRRIKTAGNVLQEWQKARALDGLTVVILFDEAQNAPGDVLATLSDLHKAGLPGVRSVVLLAGLSHAKSILKGAGISRVADNANVDMGAMAFEECAESTRLMLEDLGVEGTDAEVEQFAQRIAEHSRGWPQHLNRAQKTLCQRLLEADGVLGAVDPQAVERMADEARAEHYRGRLDDERFGGDSELVQRIISAIDAGEVYTDADLRSTCGNEIATLQRNEDPHFKLTPKDMADALVEKGITCRDESDRYRIPIPSMVTWAKDQLRERGRAGRETRTVG